MWAQQRVKNTTRSWTLSWSAQYLLGGTCLCFRCVWFGQNLHQPASYRILSFLKWLFIWLLRCQCVCMLIVWSSAVVSRTRPAQFVTYKSSSTIFCVHVLKCCATMQLRPHLIPGLILRLTWWSQTFLFMSLKSIWFQQPFKEAYIKMCLSLTGGCPKHWIDSWKWCRWSDCCTDYLHIPWPGVYPHRLLREQWIHRARASWKSTN